MSDLTDLEICKRIAESMSVALANKGDKSSTISVSTKKAKFSIRSTNNGSIRFFDDQGNECELVNKDYLEQQIEG